MKRLITVGATLAVLLTGVVGCSLGPPFPSASPPTPETDVTASSAGQPPPATAAPPSADQDDLGPVIASRTGSIGGHRVEVQLHRIVRDHGLAQLSFVLTSADDVTVGGALSDDDVARGDVDNDTADGVTLIDPAQSKVYLVASADFRCLCARFGGTKLGHDQPLVAFATFAAPPSGVTSLQVQVPGFGVFNNVPVV